VGIRAIVGRLGGFVISFLVSSPEHFVSSLFINALYWLSLKHLPFILTKKIGLGSDVFS